jgi:hypothetical protein
MHMLAYLHRSHHLLMKESLVSLLSLAPSANMLKKCQLSLLLTFTPLARSARQYVAWGLQCCRYILIII